MGPENERASSLLYNGAMRQPDTPAARVLAIALPILLLAGCASLLLGDSEADWVIEDLLAGPGDSRLKAATPPAQRSALVYEVERELRYADLYRPGTPPRAALVLVPGLVPGGKDDSRLVGFASTLSRAGFLILVPDLMGFRQYQVRAADVVQLVDAIDFLAGQPEAAGLPLGIGGFSFAVGPVVLAAADAAVRDSVDFVVGVGGYYHLPSVISFFTTGALPPERPLDRPWRGPEPHPHGKWILALSNADLLSDPGEREAFRALARQRLAGRSDPREAEDFSPEGQALYRLLTNTDPARVQTLIDGLPPALAGEIRALDLAAQDLSGLRARLILVHGRRDNLMPFPESEALAAALPEGQATVFPVQGMAHVDVRPGITALPDLVRAVDALLAERLPEPADLPAR